MLRTGTADRQGVGFLPMNNVEAWGTESSREIGPHSKRPTHRWKINAARTQWHRLSLHGHGMGIMERFSHTVEGSRVNRASCNSIKDHATHISDRKRKVYLVGFILASVSSLLEQF